MISAYFVARQGMQQLTGGRVASSGLRVGFSEAVEIFGLLQMTSSKAEKNSPNLSPKMQPVSSRTPGARLFESGFFGFVDQFIAAGLIVITHYPKLWHNTLQVVHGCVPLAITSFSAWPKMHLAHLTKTRSAAIDEACGQIKKT